MEGETLTDITGVGAATMSLFAKLGIRSIANLIEDYPRRYEDFSTISLIARLRPGPVSIRAVITAVSGRYARRGMHVTEAIATDASGSVRLVWFNQPYRQTSLSRSAEYFISGEFALSHQHFSIANPSIELASDFPTNAARIIPIYRETKGLTSNQIRKIMQRIRPRMQMLVEPLPNWLVQANKLMPFAKAVEAIHFPRDQHELNQAKERLGFNEVFLASLASLLNKYEIRREQAPAVPFEEQVARRFVAELPFTLTDAQRKTIWKIYLDMQNTYPMNRLVEGDVGSGKTVVAAMAAVMVLHHGHQVAFMAPTEILARQHAETLRSLLAPLGYDGVVGLLVGSMSAAQKATARQNIANGNMRLIVGTQALIQFNVNVNQLELIIIDEQHRFGVEQRKSLIAKAGHMPHVLNLTATPIPRSLALTLYGELDISVLDQKPTGRQAVVTEIHSPNSRTQLYNRIAQELQSGRQMFVVCPLISAQSHDESADALHSAELVYETLRSKVFPKNPVGLLHGKMKPADKTAIMQAFVDHAIDILVSTTVIEVGVDVPNATVMLIEGAERFGLAQIHQLRGRVGRGTHQGYCYLITSDSKPPSPRLRAIERSENGFQLAELDLRLRGPGAMFGIEQHGPLDLRIAQLSDIRLIARARQAAQAFIGSDDDLSHYPSLQKNVADLRIVSHLN